PALAHRGGGVAGAAAQVQDHLRHLVVEIDERLEQARAHLRLQGSGIVVAGGSARERAAHLTGVEYGIHRRDAAQGPVLTAKASSSAATASTCPRNGACAAPGSSTKRDPGARSAAAAMPAGLTRRSRRPASHRDRKSTRL